MCCGNIVYLCSDRQPGICAMTLRDPPTVEDSTGNVNIQKFGCIVQQIFVINVMIMNIIIIIIVMIIIMIMIIRS